MSQVTVPETIELQPLKNGHYGIEEHAPDLNDFVFSAITVGVKSQLTRAVQRIKDRAEQSAAFFNAGPVSVRMVILSILNDPDGGREVLKRKIPLERAYADCMATLQTYRTPGPRHANDQPALSEPVKRVFELARKSASAREDGIDIVAVGDLVHAILALPDDMRAKEVPLGFQPVASSKWRVAAVVLACCTVIAALAGMLVNRGLVAWNWHALTNWLA